MGCICNQHEHIIGVIEYNYNVHNERSKAEKKTLYNFNQGLTTMVKKFQHFNVTFIKQKVRKLKYVSYDSHPHSMCAGARVGSDIITLDGFVISQALF